MGGSAWGFHVGGIRVCEKWLEDRRHRQLTYDELMSQQLEAATARQGRGDLARLLHGGDTWQLG